MKPNNVTPKEAYNILENIVVVVKQGGLTYEQGKKEAQPYINIINEKAVEIAKKYNARPKKISWLGMTR
jgi:hypothetical protein